MPSHKISPIHSHILAFQRHEAGQIPPVLSLNNFMQVHNGAGALQDAGQPGDFNDVPQGAQLPAGVGALNIELGHRGKSIMFV